MVDVWTGLDVAHLLHIYFCFIYASYAIKHIEQYTSKYREHHNRMFNVHIFCLFISSESITHHDSGQSFSSMKIKINSMKKQVYTEFSRTQPI